MKKFFFEIQCSMHSLTLYNLDTIIKLKNYYEINEKKLSFKIIK